MVIFDQILIFAAGLALIAYPLGVVMLKRSRDRLAAAEASASESATSDDKQAAVPTELELPNSEEEADPRKDATASAYARLSTLYALYNANRSATRERDISASNPARGEQKTTVGRDTDWQVKPSEAEAFRALRNATEIVLKDGTTVTFRDKKLRKPYSSRAVAVSKVRRNRNTPRKVVRTSTRPKRSK